jgi:hypothetical protein
MFSDRALRIMADLGWSRLCAEPVMPAHHLVGAAQAALPVTGVGLALKSHNEPGVLVAATDQVAEYIEELQFIVGEGPSSVSAAIGRPVLIEDLAGSEAAWPAFTAGAVEAGVAAVFAFPVRVDEIPVGVLELYRDTPGPLAAADVTEALAWATVGAWVLLHLTPGVLDDDLFPDLTERLASRSLVHRATGVLAHQLGISTDDSLAILRARAFSDQKPIADLACDVLTQLTAGDTTTSPIGL